MLAVKGKADGSGNGSEEKRTSRRSGVAKATATVAVGQTGNVARRRRQGKRSVVYADNKATKLIANHTRPTARTRHVDIRWFALQHWTELGLIILIHVPGTNDIADAMTKALGWILQQQKRATTTQLSDH